MRLFTNLNQMAAEWGYQPVWMQTVKALQTVGQLSYGQAYSIGTSVTYWHDLSSRLFQENLSGKRMYYTIIMPLHIEVPIEVALKKMLKKVDSYSDLSDSEEFYGTGKTIILKAGEVLVIPTDEAYRIYQPTSEFPESDCAVVHTTAMIDKPPSGLHSL